MSQGKTAHSINLIASTLEGVFQIRRLLFKCAKGGLKTIVPNHFAASANSSCAAEAAVKIIREVCVILTTIIFALFWVGAILFQNRAAHNKQQQSDSFSVARFAHGFAITAQIVPLQICRCAGR